MAEPINTGPCAPVNASGIGKNQATTAGNSGEQKVINPVMADMEKHMENLNEKQAEYADNYLQNRLNAFMVNCKDMSKSIQDILKNDRKPTKRLIALVSSAIVEAVNGNFITPMYVARMQGAQNLRLYTGTYWTDLDKQVFYDFVTDFATKIGLPDEYTADPQFMNQLFHRIAFRVAHEQKQIVQQDKKFINLQNGTLVIFKDGTCYLREHRRSDNFLYVLPYSFDPNADCEKFKAFLDKMLPEKEAQDLLAEFLGTILVPEVKIEKMLALYGQGSNGKSVLLDIITALFGAENVSNVALDDLTNDEKMRALINHKKVNISTESDKEVKNAILKQIVSGEKVTAYINYVGPITLEHYAKLITSFNILPGAENTHGFFRRWILMPWRVTISSKDADKNLAKKIIAAELPGILNWVIQGLIRFLTNYQFTDSPLCDDALNKYRLRSDNVKLFFSECYEASESFSTPGKDLFENYKKYCYKDGLKPVGKQTFFDRFEAVAGNRFTYQNQIMFHVIQKPDNDKAPF